MMTLTRRRQDPAEVLGPVTRTVVMTILLLAILVPLLYMVDMSVTPDTEVSTGVLVPSHLDIAHYATMWKGTGLLSGIEHSALICGVTSILAMIVGGTAGYVVSRLPFRGRGILLNSLLGFQAVPVLMTVLPLFMVMVSIQNALRLVVIGTYWSVVIAYLTFSLPLVTWLVKSYIDNLATDLEDAARLDGAGALTILWRVVMPVAAPAAVVAAVFAFLTGWGDLVVATVLTGPSSDTVAVALNSFLQVQEGGAVPAYGTLMAASIISALPVVFVFVALQRYFISGLVGSAAKG